MSKSLYPVVPGLSWRDIEITTIRTSGLLFDTAKNLLAPKAMFNLFQDGTLGRLGFTYGVESLPVGEEGKFDPGTNEIILSLETYDNLACDAGRAKFTLAHEIGHAVLHGAYLKDALTSRRIMPQYKRSQIPKYADPECQANKFASYFLMPRALILPLIQRGRSVTEIARYFGVSYQAAEIRCADFKKVRASNF